MRLHEIKLAASQPPGGAAASVERLHVLDGGLDVCGTEFGRWPELWAKFRPLIGILSQNARPDRAMWANSVRLTIGGGDAAGDGVVDPASGTDVYLVERMAAVWRC